MKHHSLSKVLKRLACVLAALVIALAVAVFALWHNELATLSSLKKLSDRDEAHRDRLRLRILTRIFTVPYISADP